MLKGFRVFFILSLFSLILGSVHFISNGPFSKDYTDELNVFVWSDLFNIEMINDFEKSSNLKVNLHFYNSNEELLAKLRLTGGKGFDLLFPSDYTCKILKEDGFLQRIDKSRIDDFDKIFPFFIK